MLFVLVVFFNIIRGTNSIARAIEYISSWCPKEQHEVPIFYNIYIPRDNPSGAALVYYRVIEEHVDQITNESLQWEKIMILDAAVTTTTRNV